MDAEITNLKNQIVLLRNSNEELQKQSDNSKISQDLEISVWDFAREVDGVFNRL